MTVGVYVWHNAEEFFRHFLSLFMFWYITQFLLIISLSNCFNKWVSEMRAPIAARRESAVAPFTNMD